MKPNAPIHDLSIAESRVYFDTLVEHYTGELGEDITRYKQRQKIYETSLSIA